MFSDDILSLRDVLFVIVMFETPNRETLTKVRLPLIRCTASNIGQLIENQKSSAKPSKTSKKSPFTQVCRKTSLFVSFNPTLEFQLTEQGFGWCGNWLDEIKGLIVVGLFSSVRADRSSGFVLIENNRCFVMVLILLYIIREVCGCLVPNQH